MPKRLTMRLPTLLSAALLFAACSSTGPIPPSPGQASGYFRVGANGYDQLGRTGDTGPGIWIELEEASYVAVFHLLQDVGAVLVWPFSEASPRVFPAGLTDIPPLTSDEQRIARWREAHLLPSPDTDRVQRRGLVLVVAGSQPLDIDRYLVDHEALKRDLGGAFTDDTRAVARILDLVVENPYGHNWGWTCTGTPVWCRGR